MNALALTVAGLGSADLDTFSEASGQVRDSFSGSIAFCSDVVDGNFSLLGLTLGSLSLTAGMEGDVVGPEGVKGLLKGFSFGTDVLDEGTKGTHSGLSVCLGDSSGL